MLLSACALAAPALAESPGYSITHTYTLGGDGFRAVGEFEIDRKKFNVNATDAFHGFVRVKHELKFTFDIAARRVS